MALKSLQPDRLQEQGEVPLVVMPARYVWASEQK